MKSQFSVNRSTSGKINSFLLNGKKYPGSGKIVVPRADLEPIPLSAIPKELILDFHDDYVSRIHVQAIQYTDAGSTQVVILVRDFRRRVSDPVVLAKEFEQFHQAILTSNNKHVQFLLHHDDGECIMTAFVVTAKGQTVGDAINAATLWCDTLAQSIFTQ